MASFSLVPLVFAIMKVFLLLHNDKATKEDILAVSLGVAIRFCSHIKVAFFIATGNQKESKEDINPVSFVFHWFV